MWVSTFGFITVDVLEIVIHKNKNIIKKRWQQIPQEKLNISTLYAYYCSYNIVDMWKPFPSPSVM